METIARHSLSRLGIAAAVAALTSLACNNNSDYKTRNATASDSSTTQLNPASGATPAGQPATTRPVAAKRSSAGQSIPAVKDTIDNMGQVRPATAALKPNADKEGVAKTGTATPTTRTAGMHNRKKVTATVVVTEPMAGATAPQFPGGQQALDNYVNDHVNYPQNAIDNDVSGIVRVSFVVDENGKITKVKLANPRKLGDGLDEEALRVVRSMPEWRPGTLHGRKVKTRLELPISFQVES